MKSYFLAASVATALVASTETASASLPVTFDLHPGEQYCMSVPTGLQCWQYMNPWAVPGNPGNENRRNVTISVIGKMGLMPSFQCYRAKSLAPDGTLTFWQC